MATLSSEDLCKQYKGLRVVDAVDINVRSGEVVGLLGPNGAGKTTTFYMIAGLYKPEAGAVYLNDEDITNYPMYVRARKGISYLPQEASVFRKLTVEENVLAILQTLEIGENERRERLSTLLNNLGIASLAKSKAYVLSGGERRRLEITRALVTSPFFLLFDEPFTGIDPLAISDISDLVGYLKQRGLGVLITDHQVRETLQIVDRASIIYEGRVLFEGAPDDVLQNEDVRRVYLGERFAA